MSRKLGCVEPITTYMDEPYLTPASQFKEGEWAGVEFDTPTGKNDGSVDGVQYFQWCARLFQCATGASN